MREFSGTVAVVPGTLCDTLRTAFETGGFVEVTVAGGASIRCRVVGEAREPLIRDVIGSPMQMLNVFRLESL